MKKQKSLVQTMKSDQVLEEFLREALVDHFVSHIPRNELGGDFMERAREVARSFEQAYPDALPQAIKDARATDDARAEHLLKTFEDFFRASNPNMLKKEAQPY